MVARQLILVLSLVLGLVVSASADQITITLTPLQVEQLGVIAAWGDEAGQAMTVEQVLVEMIARQIQYALTVIRDRLTPIKPTPTENATRTLLQALDGGRK